MATKQDINETKKILNDLTTNTILFFDDIQNAIKNAGVEISEDLSIDNYNQMIDQISESSKKKQENLFWTTMQKNEILQNHVYTFTGAGWNSDTFKPQYDIIPQNTNGSYMFAYTTNLNIDLAQRLEDLGVKLDFINTVKASFIFRESKVTRIPELNLSNSNSIECICYNCTNLEIIDKLILNAEKNTLVSNMLAYCSKLREVNFEGSLGLGVSIKSCVSLNKESITSLINILKEDAIGQTLTLSLTAVNTAFETEEGLKNGSTSEEWINLITSKSNQYNGNWTISLS